MNPEGWDPGAISGGDSGYLGGGGAEHEIISNTERHVTCILFGDFSMGMGPSLVEKLY